MSDIASGVTRLPAREIALRFLTHAFKGEMESALAMLSSDATWWVPGNADKVKACGTRDLPRIRRFLENIRRGWPDGMDVKFTGVTAEGGRVAIEAESTAVLADGRDYHNRYHFLLLVVDGLVQRIHEYMDTQYAHEVQLASAPPPR